MRFPFAPALSASFAFGLPIGAVRAEDAAAPVAAETSPDATVPADQMIVVTSRRTRSVAEVAGPEIQRILPGISPLKAIQTLPGSPI